MHSRTFSACRLSCRYVLFVAGDVAFTDEGKRRVQMLTEAMYIAGTRPLYLPHLRRRACDEKFSVPVSVGHMRVWHVRLLQVATVAEASLPYPPNSCTS